MTADNYDGVHAHDAHVRAERRGETLVLWLNRPKSRNAFSLPMLKDLEREIACAWEDGCRVIVLVGAGAVFSSGGDIKFARELLADPDRNDAIWEDLMATFGRVVVGLQESPCLSIAAVQGPAVGAGVSLALAADMRVMAEEAAFMPVWLDKGVVPDGGGSYFLARMLSPAHMFRLALNAEPIPSRQALELGLADEIASASSVLDQALEMADRMSARSGNALVALRRLADSATRATLAEQTAYETDELRDLRKGAERRAALSLD